MASFRFGAAVLWTGGKDSCLALHDARSLGIAIRCLVTFVPTKPNFRAHPLSFLTQQASALGLPHNLLLIEEPFFESYQKALASLKSEGIDTLITGDIAEVGGQPNWIRECAEPLDIKVITPLWGADRLEVLQRLVDERVSTIFSCVKSPWLTKDWVGRKVDDASIRELQLIRVQTGLDLCGEQGEFHTLVTDAPRFKKRIQIDAFGSESDGNLHYIQLQRVSFVEKATETHKKSQAQASPAAESVLRSS
jgi:diphthine-ammonia ligase